MILREAEIKYTGRRVEGAGRIRCAADVHRICHDIADDTVEKFYALHLGARNEVLSRQLVAQGSATSVQIHPREVFRGAVLAGAVSVILVHNHPSGDPTPSSEDLTITGRLRQVGDLLEIKVLDHVIIGDGRYYSFSEQGI